MVPTGWRCYLIPLRQPLTFMIVYCSTHLNHLLPATPSLFSLKTSDSYEVPEGQQVTTRRKRRELVAVVAAVQGMRVGGGGDMGFVCFVVINPRVLSANRVDLGYFFVS